MVLMGAYRSGLSHRPWFTGRLCRPFLCRALLSDRFILIRRQADSGVLRGDGVSQIGARPLLLRNSIHASGVAEEHRPDQKRKQRRGLRHDADYIDAVERRPVQELAVIGEAPRYSGND